MRMDLQMGKDRTVKGLTLLYLVITLILIYAEYIKHPILLYIFKPLLMPVLALMYIKIETKINRYFLFSLLFIWIANICFINVEKTMFVVGAFNTFVSKIFVFLLLLKKFKFPNWTPFIVGTLPFLMLSVSVLELISDSLGNAYYFYLLNGALVISIGGLVMANYFIYSNKVNTYVLISVMMSTFIQFLAAVDFYYVSVQIFRPIIIVTFSISQYIFYQSVLMMNWRKEKTKKKALNNNTSASI